MKKLGFARSFGVAAGVLMVLSLLLGGILTGQLGADEVEEQGFSGVINFVKPAIASASGSGAGFLDDEAGITAFVFMDQAIDIQNMQQFYNSIEKQTSSYIVGSVTPIKYEVGSEDVHFYVNSDGWFVAWHHKGAAATHIVDWKNYQVGSVSTTLHNALAEMVVKGTGQPLSPGAIQMYDFSNPQANGMMVIADTAEFYVTIPQGVYLHRVAVSIGDPAVHQNHYRYQDIPRHMLLPNGERKRIHMSSSYSGFYNRSENTITINEEIVHDSRINGAGKRIEHMAMVLVYEEL